MTKQQQTDFMIIFFSHLAGVAVGLAIAILFSSCSSLSNRFENATPRPIKLDWAKPKHQPAWTYPEDWELRNHDRLPDLDAA